MNNWHAPSNSICFNIQSKLSLGKTNFYMPTRPWIVTQGASNPRNIQPPKRQAAHCAGQILIAARTVPARRSYAAAVVAPKQPKFQINKARSHKGRALIRRDSGANCIYQNFARGWNQTTRCAPRVSFDRGSLLLTRGWRTFVGKRDARRRKSAWLRAGKIRGVVGCSAFEGGGRRCFGQGLLRWKRARNLLLAGFWRRVWSVWMIWGLRETRCSVIYHMFPYLNSWKRMCREVYAMWNGIH